MLPVQGLLLSYSGQGVMLWDLSNGELVSSLELPATWQIRVQNAVRRVCLFPDGRVAASCCDLAAKSTAPKLPVVVWQFPGDRKELPPDGFIDNFVVTRASTAYVAHLTALSNRHLVTVVCKRRYQPYSQRIEVLDVQQNRFSAHSPSIKVKTDDDLIVQVTLILALPLVDFCCCCYFSGVSAAESARGGRSGRRSHRHLELSHGRVRADSVPRRRGPSAFDGVQLAGPARAHLRQSSLRPARRSATAAGRSTIQRRHRKLGGSCGCRGECCRSGRGAAQQQRCPAAGRH